MLPDSFQPYLLNKVISNTVNYTTSGTTDLLTQGQLGIFTCPAYTGVYGNAISSGTATPCIIACGSWYTADTISPLWGGLQEPDYTQIIEWNRVNAFIYTQAQAAQNQVSVFGWNLTSGTTAVGPLFQCGTTYSFQLEVLGSPVLWFLNHQYYRTLTAFSGCCGTGCTSGCTSTYVDAGVILLQWKDQLTQDPYWPSFVTPNVYINSSGSTTPTEIFSAYDTSIGVGTGTYTPNTSNPQSVVAGLKITVAYAETRFANCTFSPTDHFEIEPLYVEGSLFTQDASPCAVNTTIDTSVPTMWTQLTAPLQVRGIGEQVVRNLIEWGRYKQEDFADSQWVGSLRMREIELNWELNAVTRTALYDAIMLKFNKYRSYNTQSIHDNDEYAVTIYFPTGTVITPFTALINSCLSTAGNSVQMVTW